MLKIWVQQGLKGMDPGAYAVRGAKMACRLDQLMQEQLFLQFMSRPVSHLPNRTRLAVTRSMRSRFGR